MARRTITVTVRHSAFVATETFMSRADALAWREMVETTLDHREKARFDLTVYARGLADTVRTHGGAYTRDRWLNVDVPQEQWIRGLPVELDHEATIPDVSTDDSSGGCTTVAPKTRSAETRTGGAS